MRKSIVLGGIALGSALLFTATSCVTSVKEETFSARGGIIQVGYDDDISIPLYLSSYSSEDTNGEYVHKFKFKDSITASDIVLKGSIVGKNVAVRYDDEYNITVYLTGSTTSKTDKCGAIAVASSALLDDFEKVVDGGHYFMRVMTGTETKTLNWNEWPSGVSVLDFF